MNKGAKSFLSNKYQDWHGLLNHQPQPQRIFSLLEEGEKLRNELRIITKICPSVVKKRLSKKKGLQAFKEGDALINSAKNSLWR